MLVGPYEIPGYHVGDVRTLLRALPDESVQCVVTSPPYWGLRKYAGQQAGVWGGLAYCEHEWHDCARLSSAGGKPGKTAKVGATIADVQRYLVLEGTCSKCGAWRGDYGCEPTPALYVEHTVEILREIRRVLRSDGVCFWNVGDSYVANPARSSGVGDGYRGSDTPTLNKEYQKRVAIRNHATLKPKDLVLIPHRVAIAAQDDGWYVRSDIIWAKTNPMPESVNDRPTSSYEHIFMFTKSPKYYWNIDAVREAHTMKPQRRLVQRNSARDQAMRSDKKYYYKMSDIPVVQGNSAGRNMRNCWMLPTRPFKGAHFAVFSPVIPQKCILAASKEGDLILDPFAGSGTTLAMAHLLGRQYLGFDISQEYKDLFAQRVLDVGKWFAKQQKS